MSQCTLQSNRPKTVIRLGNDTPLLLALTLDTGEIINLNEVTNLSVAIVSARSGRAITPPWQVTPSGGLSIEFSASNQSIGIYGLRVQFNRPSSGFSGQQAYAWEDTNLIEVVPTSTALPSDAPNTISGVLGALMKGDKGDPGDPTELLDELSRQQTARLDEIAAAQRESLTSIGARLSDEQRTALEELSGRLSREQGDKTAQQTERLSTEQASGLQGISDRLSSEQAHTLERHGRERATAQAEALKALDQEVNRKYDTALEGLSGKVDEAIQREVPKAVSAQLPAALTAQLPSQLSESLPSIIGLDDQSRMTIGGQAVGESLKGADGLTPYIKDRTWWIGDTDTGVTAEVNRDIFSVEDWLKMANLTDNKALLVDRIIGGNGVVSRNWTPDDAMQRYKTTDDGVKGVPLLGYAGFSQFEKYWIVIDDFGGKYGPNTLFNIKFKKTHGGGFNEFLVMYWKQGEKWIAVNEHRDQQDKNIYHLSAHIEQPIGAILIYMYNVDIAILSVDVWSSSTDSISYPMGTWLARNKAPRKGDTYLCTNIGSQGERVLLAYDGHNWLTSWGGRITGETTREARDSYLQAILALRKAIITPPNLAEG